MFGINEYELAIMALVLLPFLLVGVGLVRGLTGRTSRVVSQSNSEEARLVQQIFEDLQRMERRVEALETILLDRVRDQERV